MYVEVLKIQEIYKLCHYYWKYMKIYFNQSKSHYFCKYNQLTIPIMRQEQIINSQLNMREVNILLS